MAWLGVSKNQVILRLFLISTLSLFCEMLVIRWLSTEIRVFAYFKNLPLMAAFLGLGLGFIWSDKKRDLMKWSGISLLYFSGLMIVAIGLHLTHLTIFDSAQVMFFGEGFKPGGISPLTLISNLLIMMAVFSLAASIFVGLGQQTGRLFKALPPLKAYSINVAGALAGVILFALLSQLSLGPGMWLIVAGLLYFLLGRKISAVALMILGISYALYLAPSMAKLLYGPDYVTTVWSPYYRIDVRKARLKLPDRVSEPMGYDIFINYDSFQSIMDCTPATLAKLPNLQREKVLEYYDRSFCVTAKTNPDILILGAGSGSDVAAALRCNPHHVDAVEIDPAIYELGKSLHPEHPYDSPKVSAHIMDARTFLKSTRTKYDVIFYAILDSHTAFSSLSSLRTDNYIFTEQSYRDAWRLLKPNGYIAVCFVDYPQWLFDRHAKDLYRATGRLPVGYRWVTSLPLGFLVTGPNINGASQPKLHFSERPRQVNMASAVPEITDDWPFLFLPQREIPVSYLLPILAVLLVSIFPISRLIVSGSLNMLNGQMFCLGMGFMLLEVRAISAISLLCGATWAVNSVVISGVLIVILLGNLLASRLSVPAVTPLIAITVLAVFLSNLVDVGSLNAFDANLAIVIGTSAYLLPLLFAATVFSSLFKLSNSVSHQLAFNIMGGLLGVALEYFSMAFGIKSLAYIAVAIYSGVLILELLRVRSAIPSQYPVKMQPSRVRPRSN